MKNFMPIHHWGMLVIHTIAVTNMLGGVSLAAQPWNGIETIVVTNMLGGVSLATQPWKGIEPLVSTRSDVERQFGRCTTGKREDMCIYHFPDEDVTIYYTVGPPCGEQNKLWKVPEGTVSSITVRLSLNKLYPIEESGFDISKFSVETDPELPKWKHYTSHEKGLTLSSDRGFLKELYFFPAGKETQRCSCDSRK